MPKKVKFDKLITVLGKKRNKFYRLNQYIGAAQVRVVDEKGKQVGVMLTGEALALARKKGLDLVEVAPGTKPPVCKIIDFKKFRFLETKKHQTGKKKSKKVSTKEIRFSPFIAENDFNLRLKRAAEFLKNGDLVRLTVRFRGRQITKKDFGYELLEKAIKRLKTYAQVESEPKFNGRQLETLLAPEKQSRKNEKAQNQKINQKKV